MKINKYKKLALGFILALLCLLLIGCSQAGQSTRSTTPTPTNFDGANPGSNVTTNASNPTVNSQNITGGWMFVDANAVRYLDITQDSVNPNSATIHATLTVIGASVGNGCCDKASRLLEGGIATGSICS